MESGEGERQRPRPDPHGYPWAYDLGGITAQKLTDLTPYGCDVGYERDSYYGTVMDAGVYNGAQYRFTVPMVYTSEERLIGCWCERRRDEPDARNWRRRLTARRRV